MQITENRRAPTIRSRLGDFGLALASGGVLLFCVCSPLSIAASEIASGVAFLGLVIGFASGGIRYRPTPLDLPLLIFVIVDVASLLTAVDRQRSARSILGDWILLYAPIFMQSFRGSRDVRRAFTALVVSSTFAAVYALWQMFAGQDLVRHHPLEATGSLYFATGFFGHHLTYGGHVLLTSLLATVLAIQAGGRGRPRIVIGRGLGALVQLGAVIASFARTAWIGFAAGVAAASLASRGTVRRFAAAALVGAGALAFAFPAVRARLVSVAGFSDDPRTRLWRTAIRIWRDHPTLGAGHGAFGRLFPVYKVPGTYMATGHPHNDLLNILVQSGIMGVLAFAFIWIRYFRYVSRARKIAHADANDPRGGILLAGFVVGIGFLVGGLGQCFLNDEVVSMLIWLIVAGTIVVAREVTEEAREAALGMSPAAPTDPRGH